MGLFDAALGISATGPPPDDDFWYGPAWGVPHAGVSVTPDSALRHSAVYACVWLLARSAACLPLEIYRRIGTAGDREPAFDHPIYELLHDQPNAYMTSFDWREMMFAQLLLRGNSYSQIVPGRRGPVDQLVPIHPDRVTPRLLVNGRLRYDVRLNDGSTRAFNQDDIFHVRLMTLDGIVGLNPIALHRQGISLGLAAEVHGARQFGANAIPGGVLKTKDKLDDPVQRRIKRSWQSTHGGPYRSHRIAILEQGLEWQQMGMSNKDSQYLEAREFQVVDIARIYGIPPHMIAANEKSTAWGTGIEQLSIAFVVFTLATHLKRFEQAIKRDLITNKRQFFAEHNVAGLMRGDFKSRMEAYGLMLQNGLATIDELRRRENMNRLKKGGDVARVQMQMTPVESAGGGVGTTGTRGNGANATAAPATEPADPLEGAA